VSDNCPELRGGKVLIRNSRTIEILLLFGFAGLVSIQFENSQGPTFAGVRARSARLKRGAPVSGADTSVGSRPGKLLRCTQCKVHLWTHRTPREFFRLVWV
jgi:hypothetical protein